MNKVYAIYNQLIGYQLIGYMAYTHIYISLQ
jgi:hypothetical protein